MLVYFQLAHWLKRLLLKKYKAGKTRSVLVLLKLKSNIPAIHVRLIYVGIPVTSLLLKSVITAHVLRTCISNCDPNNAFLKTFSNWPSPPLTSRFLRLGSQLPIVRLDGPPPSAPAISSQDEAWERSRWGESSKSPGLAPKVCESGPSLYQQLFIFANNKRAGSTLLPCIAIEENARETRVRGGGGMEEAWVRCWFKK